GTLHCTSGWFRPFMIIAYSRVSAIAPPPAGMGKHQDGGIKRGMAENLPFQSFIHILFLKFAFAGRRAANAGVR
ncbi:TPA: hypothetical protein ACFJTC_000981, partial [Neisseria gonorrhoeae]